jgi:hypothetical protein
LVLRIACHCLTNCRPIEQAATLASQRPARAPAAAPRIRRGVIGEPG